MRCARAVSPALDLLAVLLDLSRRSLSHNAYSALHALVGLARGRDGYTQTVLDILCAYLRMPSTMDDRELQVRNTAQRLLIDLLPPAGADLRYSRRRIGTRVMRDANLNAWATEVLDGKARILDRRG